MYILIKLYNSFNLPPFLFTFVCAKPDRPDELERVEAAGGRVINWNGHRVLGVLATSRSIGNQIYLQLRTYIIFHSYVNVIWNACR